MTSAFTNPMNSFHSASKSGSKGIVPQSVDSTAPTSDLSDSETITPATRAMSLAELRAVNSPKADQSTALVRPEIIQPSKGEGKGKFSNLVRRVVKGQSAGVPTSIVKKMKQAAVRARISTTV